MISAHTTLIKLLHQLNEWVNTNPNFYFGTGFQLPITKQYLN